MPSADRGEAGGRWAWLRSQGLGLACGLATVALLAVGSFALTATADGASRAVRMDDLRAFVERPAAAHLWFYLLVPVLGLYALNTALATWHSVARKVRSGMRSPAAYAASVIHAGFLLALVAHGVSGLLGGDRGETVLAAGGAWRTLPDGRQARLLSLEVATLPGGMPRSARGRVEVAAPGGAPHVEELDYNEPLSSGSGSELHLLGDFGELPAADLAVAGAPCRAAGGERCAVPGPPLLVLGVVPPGRGGGGIAQVEAFGRVLWLTPGVDVPLPDGRPVRLVRVVAAPAVVLRSRHAPGNPWALAGALLVLAGLLLMARKLAPARRSAAEPALAADEPGASG